MEGVAGLMRNLKLSEEEKKGVKIRLSAREKGKETEMQAIGKVMSEKLAHRDAICLSLGRVWCPIKGIECNEVGDNMFLFTFRQESGKRKAIDNGPWMFDKDLVVVEEYVPSKRLSDYEFNDVPIWVRVFDLPLGMMNEDSAEEIGNLIGRFVEVDAGVDGKAIGKFLRIKIRYSSSNFVGLADTGYTLILLNTRNATGVDLAVFNRAQGKLMSRVASEAGDAANKGLATDTTRLGGGGGGAKTTIYGLGWCTRDITAADCGLCMAQAVAELPNYCRYRRGCRVIYSSCMARYEVYPFFFPLGGTGESADVVGQCDKIVLNA